MSNLKKLLVLPLVLSLIGCATQKAPADVSKEEESSEVSSEIISSEEESTTVEESSEEVVYTVEGVAADIGTALGGVTLTDKDTYYTVTLNFSQDSVDYSNTQAEEAVLKPVIDTLKLYMPEYLELVGEKYFTSEEDFWEDESGDTVYYALLGVSEVEVGLISYCYMGYLLGQIEVYAA